MAAFVVLLAVEILSTILQQQGVVMGEKPLNLRMLVDESLVHARGIKASAHSAADAAQYRFHIGLGPVVAEPITCH
nr:hypothetical protein [Aliagarivorans taiwanensis]